MGKRYGKLIPAIRAALGQSDGSIIAKLAARGELLKLDVEGQTIELAPEALLIETTAAEGFACAEDAGYLVGLDTALTDELVREGLIREILRTVRMPVSKRGSTCPIALFLTSMGTSRSWLLCQRIENIL